MNRFSLSPQARLFLFTLILGAMLFSGCVTRPTEKNSAANPTETVPLVPGNITLDVRPFVEMARTASCADITNRLYVIDDRLVFWTSVGNCDDAGYAHILYGATPQQKLCSSADSFVGPQTSCQPEFDLLFQTILAHLEQPDLGLGEAHQVVRIDPFTP